MYLMARAKCATKAFDPLPRAAPALSFGFVGFVKYDWAFSLKCLLKYLNRL